MTTNTKTVAFVNLKGGVGKTTSAIGTAEALARLGHTVTVRDADPSGAATRRTAGTCSPGRGRDHDGPGSLREDRAARPGPRGSHVGDHYGGRP